MATSSIECDVRARIVDVADRLFYARGIQAVGMDAIRTGAGVSLKKLYAAFPGKEQLIAAVLAGRHDIWERGVRGAVDAATTPRDKLLAMYDFLESWFGDDAFRGCGFINAFGELGATSPAVAEIARAHKDSFQRFVHQLTADAVPDPDRAEELAAQLALLAEGAQTTAAIAGSTAPAVHARRAAATLIDAATRA
ncbi:TetR/AcrR family transcriptional regulator [Curtobacterium pusillum]|uniref:TetR/AcrR family transcriptional regulator n=1 Tax=Curtobacterium pusillum TaxID=69373 RepID=A0ABX2MCA8_9MICO|nr:TetR/AcrR family transcriptional regulator [Curtobacterium pusillum]NUU13301.1 TetR/AcrR family transcriptional regulator [Curtobacterium pusillum]GLK30808.1 TetR family transcriptional regulator [Curtobacterium pusillum]